MRKLFIPILTFLFTINLNAQDREDNAWKAFFADYSITASKTIRFETHVRTKRFFTENDQYLLRPSIIFKLNENSNFTAGVTFISTNQTSDRIIENNLWQQFNFSYPIKRSRYFGWIRLEQRWQKQGNSPSDFGSRIRFRTGFQFPLTSNTKSTPYFVVFNEVFLNIEKNFPYRYDQNWTFFGFQKRTPSNLLITTGFQRNSISRGNNSFLHKNIWSTLLIYKI